MDRRAYAIEFDKESGKIYIIDGVGRTDITHLAEIDSIDKNYKRCRADITISFTAQMFTED